MSEAEFLSSITKIRNGDQEGLREIYDAYMPYIYKIVYELLQSKENAEDITSDFFIRIWKIAVQYKPGNGHRGWMATIARNMCIDFIRKSRREILTEELPEDKPSASRYMEDEIVGDINLQEALSRLEESERQIVAMKILGEMKFREIAKTLGMPMGTVTWKYQNAIKQLRRCGYE